MFRDFAIESIAMLAIYLVMIAVSLRRGQKSHALCTLPLIFLPLSHLIGLGIGNLIVGNLLKYNPYWFMISAVLIGIAVSGISISMASKLIKSKRPAFYYSVVCFSYTCIIGIIIVMSMVHSLLELNSKVLS